MNDREGRGVEETSLGDDRKRSEPSHKDLINRRTVLLLGVDLW